MLGVFNSVNLFINPNFFLIFIHYSFLDFSQTEVIGPWPTKTVYCVCNNTTKTVYIASL